MNNIKKLLLTTTLLATVGLTGNTALAQVNTNSVNDGDPDTNTPNSLYDANPAGGSVVAGTQADFTNTQIQHTTTGTLTIENNASHNSANTIDVSGGGNVTVGAGITVSNSSNTDAIGVYGGDSDIYVNGNVSNSSTGDAIDMTNTDAGESLITIYTSTATVTGPIKLGNEDDIRFTGDGTNDYAGNLSVGTTTGTQTLTVNLDADTDTLTIGGTIDDIDSFVLQEGQVTFGGAVTGGAIDIQNGADLTTLSTLNIGSNNIDLAGDANFTTGGTVTAGTILIDGTGTADFSGDTINAVVNLQDARLTFDGSTVFGGNVTLGGSAANVITSGGSDLTLSGASTSLTLTNSGGGTGNFNFGFDGGAGGSNALNISGNRNYNLNGVTVQNFETLNFTSSATTTFNGTTTTGLDNITINGVGTLVFDEANDALNVSNNIDVTGGGVIDVSNQTVTATSINISNASQGVFDGATINSALDFDGGILSTNGSTIFNGNIDFSTSGTIAMGGNIVQGTGNNSFTFSGNGSGTYSAVADDSYDGGDGTDTFNFSQTGGTMTMTGDIANYEDINVDGGATVVLQNAVTGASTIDVSGGSVLDISSVSGGTLTVGSPTIGLTSGVRVTNGTLVTGGTVLASDLEIDIANTTITGDLTFDGAGSGHNFFEFDGGAASTTYAFSNAIDMGADPTGYDTIAVNLDNDSTVLDLNSALTDVEHIRVFRGTADLRSTDLSTVDYLQVNGTANTTINIAGNSDVNGYVSFFRGSVNLTGATLNDDLLIYTDNTGTLTGDVTFGSGDNDVYFYDDASVTNSYANNFDGGAGSDTFNVGTTANTLTLSGTIDNFETINVDGGAGAVLSGDVTNGSLVRILNTGSALTYTTGTLGVANVSIDGGASFTYNSANTYAGSIREFESDEAQTLNIGSLAGTLSGVISLGNGADIVDVDGGTFTNTFSTGGDTDVITLANATFSGGFDAGDNETIIVDGGTVSFNSTVSNVGDIDIDNGATLSLNGATYSGTISERDAGENQTVTFTGAYSNLSNATIAFGGGTDTLNLTTTGTMDLGTVTGAATTTIGTNAVAILNGDVQVGDITFNNTTEAFTSRFDANGNFGSITTSGAITVNGGNTIDLVFADTSILKVGQSYTLVTDTGLGSSLSGVFDLDSGDLTQGLFLALTEDTTTADVYAIEVSSNAENVYNNATDIEGDAANLTAVTDVILSAPAGNAELDAVHAALMSASTTAAAEDIVEELGPVIDAAYLNAGLAVNAEVGTTVDNRLAALRDGSATGMSAGSYANGLQVWTEAFGQYADQKERDGVKGYDSLTTGVTFGVDTDQINEKLRAGLAVSYAYTDIDSDNANNTDTQIDSYQATLYGEYALQSDYFANAALSYAYNDIDQTRHNVGVSNLNAQADYSSQQYGVGLGVGRDVDMAKYFETAVPLTVTPQFTANYLYVDIDDYTETGAGGLNLQNVDTEEFQVLDLGLQVDAVWDVALDNGDKIKPAAHVGYSYDVINDQIASTASFSGGGAAFKTEGFEPSAHTFNIGGAITYLSNDNWEIKTEYDFEVKDDYQAHTALVKALYKF